MQRKRQVALASGGLALILLVTGLVGVAAANDRFYSVKLTGGQFTQTPHNTEVYSATISNRSTHVPLNTVDIILPADAPKTFRIRSASVAGGKSVPTISDGRIAQFRDLKIPAWTTGPTPPSITVEITADATCIGGGPWNFTSEGKQANHFNGTNNDFVLSTQHSSLSTTFAEVKSCDVPETNCPNEDFGKDPDQVKCRFEIVVKGQGVQVGPADTVIDVPEVPESVALSTSNQTTVLPLTTNTGTSYPFNYTLTFSVSALPTLPEAEGVLKGGVNRAVNNAAQLDCAGLTERVLETGVANFEPTLQKLVSPRRMVVSWVITYDSVTPEFENRPPPGAMCHGSPTPFVPRLNTLVGASTIKNQTFVAQLPDCKVGDQSLQKSSPCTYQRDAIPATSTAKSMDVIRADIPGTLTDPAYRG